MSLKVNILNISNFNYNIQYEEKGFQIKKFIDEKNIAYYIEPFVLNKNIKYVLHIFIDDFNVSYNQENIYNNIGGITRNITLEKKSTTKDIIEYTFENFDFQASYGKSVYFYVIATDLETGYAYNYKNEKVDTINTIVEEENNSNKFLIIFGIIFGIFIIILIVFLVMRKKRREKNSSELINVNSMNDKILND